jgi:AraC family transcriptional activator of pobA
VHQINIEDFTSVVFNFYSVWLEKDVTEKIRYGQNYFDFDEGTMIFIAPGQVLSAANHKISSGIGLIFHSDFIRNYPLAKTINNYGYFSYAVNEALHLSEKEEDIINSIMQNISNEYRTNIDKYSQDLIVSHIEVLLNYANRFYGRQFITRKAANHDLLTRMEQLLNLYFDKKESLNKGLPTVDYLASELNLSPRYLSDMLRSLTGQNGQQHIHEKLVEKAKEYLTTTNLSIAEIAYQLGFEHSQSFNKLFKKRTALTPLEFRHSFN